MKKFKQYLYYAVISCLVMGFSAGLGIVTVVTYQVFFGDVSDLKKSAILSRIHEETTIYTMDEKHKIGTFFNESHRSYVPIQDVPAHMIRAIVAAEDQNFYTHLGVDPVAIGKAAADGVLRGFRFRRGGSSITQQTVKNIMDRREHTFKRKFKEMIGALQLERMYSKEQILEFYLNQFHVTANGKGVGIAAQYYFNKDVRDLSLVEAAFIAGSVKAPSKYNPFIKDTRERKDRAQVEANRRKNYVLRRMYEQGWLTAEELKEAWKKSVPFNKGKFRTQEVALVSLVRGQLDKPEILEALNMDSIHELNHAGLKIFTTLDYNLQNKAQLDMRMNLSRLEEILTGFNVEQPSKFKPQRSLEEKQFYYGKITKIIKGKTPEIYLDFGLPKGVISTKAIEKAARIYALSTYKGYKYHMKEILSKIKEGDILFVQVEDYDRETLTASVDLRKKPQINGGLMSVNEGEVRSVVAGFEAKGFNRAMFATRQPGSVFKPVVFFAALQLGWTILDRIDNERRVFPFQGTYYFPRPDHKSSYTDVSMLWAGVKSENLATIALTSELVDKLNFEEFKTLLGTMDLLPQEGENPRDYHYRVAKTTGVQLENSGIREYLLKSSIEGLKPDLIFSGKFDLMRKMKKIWWGRGYKAELQNIYRIDEEEISEKERNIRISLLKQNYKRYLSLSSNLRYDWTYIKEKVKEIGAEQVTIEEEGSNILSRFRVMNSVGQQPTLAYIRDLDGEQYDPTEDEPEIILDPVPGRALNALDIQAIWGEENIFGSSQVSLDDVKLSGVLPLKYLNKIQINLEQKFNLVMGEKDEFGLQHYFRHHDFKIAIGLRYLVDLCRAMGVYSKLEPVLSFGLGTNDVSVAEVAKIYQTFSNGKIYSFFDAGPRNQLSFIKRIEDRNGNVLYETKKKETQLVDECYATQISEILRKVVTHGTGKRARGELYVELEKDGAKSDGTGKVRVPAFGKTGTTNDYRTAYFAGYVPFPTERSSTLDSVKDSYVIASYVGYDFNKSMKKGHFRISGAQGALPVWTDFAKSIIKEKHYADYLDRVDLNLIARKLWPIKYEGGCTADVKVDLTQGVILKAGRQKDSEIFDFTNFEKNGESFQNEFARNRSVKSWVNIATVSREGVRNPRRAFQPYNQGDEELDEVKILETTGDVGDPITSKKSEISRKSVPMTGDDELKSDDRAKPSQPRRTQKSSDDDLW